MGGPQASSAALPPVCTRQTRSGRLAYRVSGQGRPVIVLFSGAGIGLEGWEPLYPHIEALGTVFAWNRFGLRGSDAPPDGLRGAALVAALRQLLAGAQLAPPYLLVAHSLGGLFANLYARLHPAEVAGVLLLEATHPDDQEALRSNEAHMLRALGRLQDLPEAAFRANVQAELAAAGALAREIAAAGAFPPVPLRVVTGGLTPRAAQVSPAQEGAKRAHQDELARLSPQGGQVLAQGSGHFPQWSQPELVLEVMRELRSAACRG